MKRLAWFALLAIVAVISAGVECDREFRYEIRNSALVPDIFSSFALASQASAQVENGDPDQALATASQLVERRPIPAENLRILTMAAFRDGKPQLAGKAFVLASSRGWRDVTTQSLAFKAAVAMNDWQSACLRLMAMLNDGAPVELVRASLQTQLHSADGRAALASWLRENPRDSGGLLILAKGMLSPADLRSFTAAIGPELQPEN